jgi:hypothetical protein
MVAEANSRVIIPNGEIDMEFSNAVVGWRDSIEPQTLWEIHDVRMATSAYLLALATFGEIELLTVFLPFVPPGGPHQNRFLDYDASLHKGPNAHYRTSILCSCIDVFHEDRRASSYTTRQVLHCRTEGVLATL